MSGSLEQSSAPCPATVLVVDDEPVIRLDVCAALAEHGYRTVDAADGTEALREFRAASPALLVTDIYMPGLDGLALIMQLRRDGVRIPIIAISGDLMNYDVLDLALKLGADAAVEKPFAMQEMVSMVDSLLGAPPPCRGAR
ncbi:MAG TPA: response regulator [Dongiaceae bacterium]|jgi:CheY-like chemotaxis protein|nr:response regulator [Dongiaceae bacterium]